MRSRIASAWQRVRAIWILIAAGAVTVAYGFPGYLNFDSAVQLEEARLNRYDDWHPPLMARYWRVLDQLCAGPLLMLILQVTLFLWGVYGLARRRYSPRTAAVIAGALLLFPPVLAPMAVVWKDTQMAGFILAGTHLALGPRWRGRAAGIAMFVLAAAVRDNALAALPGLVLVIMAVWTPIAWWKRVALGAGLTLAIGGAALLANAATTDTRSYAWYHSTGIHDVAGVICHAGPMTDDEMRAALAGMELRQTSDLQARLCATYTPINWLPLVNQPSSLFVNTAGPAERVARRAAWFRLVRAYPGAYVAHRLAIMQMMLGLDGNTPAEPVCRTVAGTPGQIRMLKLGTATSKLQRVIGRKLVALEDTLLFRPWVYVLIGLVMLGYAAVRRDGMIAGLLTGGFLYEATFVIGAPGEGFRYSHWMIICVVLATLFVFVDRLRAGRAATA